MKIQFALAVFLFALCAAAALADQSANSPIDPTEPKAAMRSIRSDRSISRYLDVLGLEVVKRFSDKRLKSDGFAITLLIDGERPRMGSYRGDEPFYPASVIKLCYAAALEHDFATGSLPRDTATLRDLDRMITDSSNSATNRILDRLTGTESGPELPETELKQFADKRNRVNRFLLESGFSGFNACQKTWDDEPFGRDVQFLGAKYENRNRMTSAETARLVWLIKHGKIGSRAGCREILKYMKRRPNNPKDIQARRIGAGIPDRSALWSKGGWTNNTNHDAAYVNLPSGQSVVLVVFTKTSYQHPDIVSYIAEQVTSAVQLGRIAPDWIGPSLRGTSR